MRAKALPLMDLTPSGEPAGVASREGFFWCGHCNHVVPMAQREIDAAENAPAGSLVRLKCPRCKHHEVQWKFPTAPRPRPAALPVSQERGRELWAQVFQTLGITPHS